MKSLTKVMTGMSVAAFSVVLAGGINAEAATFTPAKTLTGINQGDSISFDAVKVKAGKAEYNAKAKWDLYEKSTSVDLSNLKTAKDSYIAVKSSSGTTEIYKIAADTQKSFKATCDGANIAITVDKKDVESADMSKYSWRTENSAWTAFSSTALDLTPYTMQGATLYIRYTGSSSSISPTTGTEKITVDGSEVTVKEIAANSFQAKEFKVKVPKKANAPTITVDYVNGKIKKNAKAQYKQATSLTAALSAQWSGSDSLMTADYTIDNSQAGTFMMQIPENIEKKKPASKIAFFSWTQANAPQVSYTKPAINGTTINNKEGELISGKLSYKVVDNAVESKATFEISTKDDENTYEIFKGKVENGKVVPDGKAVATIKAKATKPVVLNAKKVAAGTQLYIRIAGDKKTAKLPSPFSTTAVEPVYLKTPEAAE